MRTRTEQETSALGRSEFEGVAAFLGGKRVLEGSVGTAGAAHDLVLKGLPGEAMTCLLAGSVSLSRDAVLGALGVSARSYARRKAAGKGQRLPIHESGRLWRFAEVLAHATRVFGTRAAAEQWLEQPALALGGQVPIELLCTPPGEEMVSAHLRRIEHGVYT